MQSPCIRMAHPLAAGRRKPSAWRRGHGKGSSDFRESSPQGRTGAASSKTTGWGTFPDEQCAGLPPPPGIPRLGAFRGWDLALGEFLFLHGRAAWDAGNHAGRWAFRASHLGNQLPEEEGLKELFEKRYGVTRSRAILIARDQASRISSVVNERRNLDAGTTHYLWMTSRNKRVVGNPTELFPKGNSRHGNHCSRNGREFTCTDPPHDGHPGWAIQCWCHADPTIGTENIRLVASERSPGRQGIRRFPDPLPPGTPRC
jgi:hypothetical protein